MDRIQFRRDTLDNWNRVNPILLEGEIGYVLDDPNLYKMGDGIHTWDQLPFRGFDGNIVHNTGDSENAVMSQKATSKAIHEILYDVSAHNGGAVFESLQALLSSSNLSTLIPTPVRHGGMSIQFIQGSVPNSDNKYVQYHCTADEFTTDITKWVGIDITVSTDKDTDGEIAQKITVNYKEYLLQERSFNHAFSGSDIWLVYPTRYIKGSKLKLSFSDYSKTYLIVGYTKTATELFRIITSLDYERWIDVDTLYQVWVKDVNGTSISGELDIIIPADLVKPQEEEINNQKHIIDGTSLSFSGTDNWIVCDDYFLKNKMCIINFSHMSKVYSIIGYDSDAEVVFNITNIGNYAEFIIPNVCHQFNIKASDDSSIKGTINILGVLEENALFNEKLSANQINTLYSNTQTGTDLWFACPQFLKRGKRVRIAQGTSNTLSEFFVYNTSGTIVKHSVFYGSYYEFEVDGDDFYQIEVRAVSRASITVRIMVLNIAVLTRDIPINNPLREKKWAAIGDSLTEDNLRTTLHYQDYISQRTRIIVQNLGESGTGYKNKEFYNRIDSINAGTGLITFFGSGNDAYLLLTTPELLGTPSDVTDSTLCGLIYLTLKKAITNYPTTPIGVITPTPWMSGAKDLTPSNHGNVMELYCNAMVEICKRLSVPCLDLYHCSNLHPEIPTCKAETYSKDEGNGVHPDEKGHLLIASQIESFIKSII